MTIANNLNTKGVISLASSFTINDAFSFTATLTANTNVTFPSSGTLLSSSTYPVPGATAGKIMQSNGTNWIASTSTFPSSSATAGKLLMSDGTDWVSSTSIWPNTVGTSGQLVASNGTSNVYINRGQIPATETNDNASAGNVGEYISSEVLSSAAVALTTAVSAAVTSITLTAGDWDIQGNIAFSVGTGGNLSIATATLNNSIAIPAESGLGATNRHSGSVSASSLIVLPTGCLRASINSSTTYYLIANATFGASSTGAYGFIGARRAR